jgi:hypothetical protein
MASYTYYVNLDASGANDGSSEANGFETINAMNVALNGNSYSAGDEITIYFKNPSTPSTTSASINLTSVPLGAFVLFEGYGTTPGDGLNTPSNWFHNDAYIAIANHSGGQRNSVLRYFWCENSAATSGGAIGGSNTHFFQCYGDNSYSSSGVGINDGSIIQCIGVQSATTITNDLRKGIATNRGIATDCIAIGGASINSGFRFNGIFNSLILPKKTGAVSGISDVGIYIGFADNHAGIEIHGNTIYGFGSDGIYIDDVDSTPSPYAAAISKNIIYDCGGYAINSGDENGTGLKFNGTILNNFYGACTIGFSSNFPTGYMANNTLLTADPFINAAGDDFSLNNLTGGGAIIKSGAWQDWSGILAEDSQTIAGWWQRSSDEGSRRVVMH